MSIIELHVRNYKKLDKYLTIDANIISIGDEACVYQIPLEKEALRICKAIIESGYMLKFVTPKLADAHMDEVISTLSIFRDNGIDYTLVVNDLGLLYEGHKKDILLLRS